MVTLLHQSWEVSTLWLGLLRTKWVFCLSFQISQNEISSPFPPTQKGLTVHLPQLSGDHQDISEGLLAPNFQMLLNAEVGKGRVYKCTWMCLGVIGSGPWPTEGNRGMWGQKGVRGDHGWLWTMESQWARTSLWREWGAITSSRGQECCVLVHTVGRWFWDNWKGLVGSLSLWSISVLIVPQHPWLCAPFLPAGSPFFKQTVSLPFY